MAKTRTKAEPVDIWSLDDLRRVIADVRAQNEPLAIRLEDGAEVELRPVPRRPRRSKSAEREQADVEAFRSAAGGWKGLIDAEEFKRQVKAARGSNRPPVDLRLPEE